MTVTINGTTGITTPALDNNGNLDVDGGTIKLDGNYPVGTDNVALGDGALDDGSLTGNNNVAIGTDALTANTTGDRNTAVGTQAADSVTTAVAGTFVGYQAGQGITTGGSNTFVGADSGELITTGANNTIIGRYNGNQGNLDLRTQSNHIVLSDGDGNPRLLLNASGHSFFGTTSPVSPEGTAITSMKATTGNVVLALEGLSGDSAWVQKMGVTTGTGTRYMIGFCDTSSSTVGGITHNGTTVSYGTGSDYRLKENVVDMTGAINRVKQLNPSQFNFIANPDTTVDGFLAHEVQTVVPEAVTGTHNEVDDEGNPVYQGIDQSKLVPLLTASLQEAIAKIETLETTVADLQTRVTALEATP